MSAIPWVPLGADREVAHTQCFVVSDVLRMCRDQPVPR